MTATGPKGRRPPGGVVAKKSRTARQAAHKPAPAAGSTKKAAVRKPRANAGKGARAPRTLSEFMAQAVVMENDAAQRYAEFADAMEMHNNPEVAALFRKMADIENRHATQIMAEMGWRELPPLPSGRPNWDDYEAPETAPGDQVHYLMQPYHVLQLALINEQRAERFFARLVRAATQESVRKAARELQAEEKEHVALVRAWMKKFPRPDRNWANDPDPASVPD